MEEFWWQPQHIEGAEVRFDTQQDAEDFCSTHFLVTDYIQEDDDGLYLIYPILADVLASME